MSVQSPSRHRCPRLLHTVQRRAWYCGMFCFNWSASYCLRRSDCFVLRSTFLSSSLSSPTLRLYPPLLSSTQDTQSRHTAASCPAFLTENRLPPSPSLKGRHAGLRPKGSVRPSPQLLSSRRRP